MGGVSELKSFPKKLYILWHNFSTSHYMQKTLLGKWVLILLLIFLSFSILIYAKVILLPLTLAGLLAMLFMPISKWLEKKGLNRALASFICVIIFIAILAAVIYFFIWQINSITRDVSAIQHNVMAKLYQLEKFLNNSFGITPSSQEKFLKGNTPDGLSSMISSFMGSLIFFITNFIIMLVYIFMLLYSRKHLKIFILKLIPDNQKEKTENIISASSKATQHYLFGFGLLVTLLWILYSISFLIIGVKNPVFFGSLCGLLEVIPFVGSLTGITLTILMVISQGGSSAMILIVLIVYVVIQFTQFYVIQPSLLGGEVDINPLVAIVVLIIGEMVWGLGGMVIAIPLTGIAKIVFDNVEELHPYGYLLGRHSRTKENILFKLKHRLKHRAIQKDDEKY